MIKTIKNLFEWFRLGYIEMSFGYMDVCILVVGILGILGNTTAVTIFARQPFQKNFHALMMSLAIFDLIFILLQLLLFTIPQV